MSISQQIDGSTRLMGLIGAGISYSLSPLMHNFAASKIGVNAAYLPLELTESSLRSFLDLAWDIGALGFNITSPHKNFLANLLRRGDLDSVNVLRRGESWWEASSTDGLGFVRGLQQMNHQISDFDSFVILGNGGAVSALIPYLQNKPTYILRRNPARDSVMSRSNINFLPFDLVGMSRALNECSMNCLLIQATNYGQQHVNLEQFLPLLSDYSGAISDLVYNSNSVLLEFARERSLSAQNGLPMLIEQARLSQEYWWGRSISYSELHNLICGEKR